MSSMYACKLAHWVLHTALRRAYLPHRLAHMQGDFRILTKPYVIRLQSICHLQLLSMRPECRQRDGRIVRAVRRVFRSSPEQPRFEYDWQRTVRLAAFGGAIAGPMGHVWFQLLDKNILPAMPRR